MKRQRLTEKELKAIARFYMTHDVYTTTRRFQCSRYAATKAAKLYGTPKKTNGEEVAARFRKSSAFDDYGVNHFEWVPPSLAAGQHDCFIGRSI